MEAIEYARPSTIDDAVRSLRLTPLIHFDVRYAF